MKIAIRYLAQLKMAAGLSTEVIEMPAPTHVGLVLALLAERHASLRPLLLTEQGNVQPTLLLFLGDEQITAEQEVPRRNGEVLTLLTPMAGG